MISQTLAAMIGTLAFSVLFGVPGKYYISCGLIGGAGWLLYSVLSVYCSLSAVEATFFATMLVVLLSRFLAVQEACPATVFVITGIFPLVPGAGIYWTSYYLVTNQLALAQSSGFQAIQICFAIVLGIVIIFELPYSLFRKLPSR